jgi:methylenetetrahydrofolate reductase (NADPH)
MEFKELPGGLLQKRKLEKRPGTIGICAEFRINMMLMRFRIFSGGFTKEDLKIYLLDLILFWNR